MLILLLVAPLTMGGVIHVSFAATKNTTQPGLLAVGVAEQPTSAVPATSPASPAGFWITEDQAWTVQISPCPSGYCGTLVGLGESPRADVLRTDIQNPDPAKRTATLCGLSVLGNFTPSLDTPGQWENGWIYDPENGKTYQSEMKLQGSDKLKVRGFVIISVLGRTEMLTRVSAPLSHCSNVPGVATGIPAATGSS